MAKRIVLNRMKLSTTAELRNAEPVYAAEKSFLMAAGTSLVDVLDVCSATKEAVNNVISFAYGGKRGPLSVVLELDNKHAVTVIVADKGRGIPDLKKYMQVLQSSAGYSEHAGLGFSIMQTMMDCVTVCSVVGEGTTVRMTKKIGSLQG